MANCSVKDCKSNSKHKTSEISFHMFPNDPKLRKLWIAATGKIDYIPKSSSRICSQHFDRKLLKKKGKKTYLYTSAVPNMFVDMENVGIKECIPSTSSIDSSSHNAPMKEVENREVKCKQRSNTYCMQMSSEAHQPDELASPPPTCSPPPPTGSPHPPTGSPPPPNSQLNVDCQVEKPSGNSSDHKRIIMNSEAHQSEELGIAPPPPPPPASPPGSQPVIVGYLVERVSGPSSAVTNNAAAPVSHSSETGHGDYQFSHVLAWESEGSPEESAEPDPKRARENPLEVDIKIEHIDDSASDEEEEDVGAGLIAGGGEEGTVECNLSSLMFYKRLEKRLRHDISREPSLDRECEAPVVVDAADPLDWELMAHDLEDTGLGERELLTAQELSQEPEVEDDGCFSWQDDFGTFSGKEEEFNVVAGPTSPSTCPYELFTSIWDTEIMAMIVTETNKYAWQTIVHRTESETGIPASSRLLNWVETTVSEMYLFFAIMMFMAIDVRARLDEYWTTGTLGMPAFRTLMSRDRFLLLLKFLHFSDNFDSSFSSYDHKIRKIVRIIDHCNRKFQEVYTPSKHLSLDESLLLWKGKLSWVQCIRSKAARFGIKTYELCEAKTGYQLNAIMYAGMNSSGLEASIHGFHRSIPKVVLKLMERYLDRGHCLVMDNWYNQMPLTRFLKERRTDVVGTMNRRRLHVPPTLRTMVERGVPRGTVYGYHCGDISLITWKDVRLVTMVSTFHNKDLIATQRSGQDFMMPSVVKFYNNYMGGVDLKDQKLSTYLMERKRAKKWYHKVFRRLINVSIMNVHVLQTQNNKKIGRPALPQRDFRYSLIAEIIKRHRKCPPLPLPPAPGAPVHRLDSGQHLAATAARVGGRLRRSRCARCRARGARSDTSTRCVRCNVPLCIDGCFVDYHTLLKL